MRAVRATACLRCNATHSPKQSNSSFSLLERRASSAGSSGLIGVRKRDDEEYQINRALRVLAQAKPDVTMQVERITLAGCPFLPRSAGHLIQSSQVRIKCLTHCDALSDAALRQQIRWIQDAEDRRTYPNQRPVAIFALNLARLVNKSMEGGKVRELRALSDALFGACQITSKQQVVVCGVPNAGKSSIALCLTESRTLAVKKKRHYHLPRVSNKAGMTLGVKKHVLQRSNISGDDNTSSSVTLLDTPGLRPRLIHADPRFVALMLAANVTEPFEGYKKIAPHETILHMLLNATNRHAAMSRESPLYVDMLQLARPTDDAAVFLQAYRRLHGTMAGDESALIRQFQAYKFGGLVFTPHKQLPLSTRRDSTSLITLNRDSAVVYMNEEAERLVKIGSGKVVADTIIPQSMSNRVDPRNPYHSLPTFKGPSRAEKPGEPVVYPPHQRDFRCMSCAGFVKLIPDGKTICGRRHTRVQGWNTMDILCYFSRMAEAFGGQWSGRTRYLFKDSLACTLAMKHKLRSRAAAYKKYNGIKEYPVPNHLRPRRFQIDQPIPWTHTCDRKKSCREMTGQQIEKVAKKMEKKNITDHTFALLRKRGLPLPKPPKKGMRKRHGKA